jgi:hypothetical protein
MGGQSRIAGELAQASSLAVRHRVGGDMKGAAMQRLLIMKPVRLDLAVEGRRMALEPLGKDPHRDLDGAQAKQLAALVQAQVSVGQLHSRSLCKPLLRKGIRTSE